MKRLTNSNLVNVKINKHIRFKQPDNNDDLFLNTYEQADETIKIIRLRNNGQTYPIRVM